MATKNINGSDYYYTKYTRITNKLIENTNSQLELEIILEELTVKQYDNIQKYKSGNCNYSDSFDKAIDKMDKILEKLNILTADTWQYKDYHNSGLNWI